MSSDTQSGADEQADEFECTDNLEPKLFTQTELNDLVRDFGLTKEKAELLGSRFKERIREQTFSLFFKQGDLVCCSKFDGLINEFGIEYKKESWRWATLMQHYLVRIQKTNLGIADTWQLESVMHAPWLLPNPHVSYANETVGQGLNSGPEEKKTGLRENLLSLKRTFCAIISWTQKTLCCHLCT
ncbi:hypothetical protein PR048_028785 [Dryococelus australis]|uniref:Uncharacterized protein n=1 Tax=Dryococelus australis TaxID=614101 RepID=A0ABQ9GC61_9NEOP|nr:hypothetical protein PR048_028785 [Dryococelus australis]